jgi:enamine deaminase RidA (YjgF/YER057c/UK114 family)
LTEPLKRFLNPATLHRPTGYSHIVETIGGKTIYISGQVPLDSSGNLVGKDDLQAQARQAFLNLKTALAAVGADFHSVVKVNYYLLDISKIQVVRDIRDQFLDRQNPPASTAVEVRGLARSEFLIEIEAVAVVAG